MVRTRLLNRTENRFSVLGHPEWFRSGLGHLNRSKPSTSPSFTSTLSSSDQLIFRICTTFDFDQDLYYQAAFSLFQGRYDPPQAFSATDLLGDQYSVVRRCLLPALCTKQGRDDETDASEITFYNDPDDNVPLPPVPSNDPDDNVPSTEPKKNAFSVLLKTAHTPATVTAGSRRSGRPSKPSARIRDADNVASSSGTRKRARASSSATEHPVSKKVAM
ncbi:hypothetical protein EV702DRAFT_1191638 [Suillus placidus]|uniref:Uncharacterized protein n=1 Tax=Suillus placidus TaxID=48579 RepID=A0A9P7A835_9AGAM|nr:hypothetical protein EV702DRAFT_1191638 [Suillus placidus]